MYSDQIKIAKDRIPVLIGKKGQVKNQLQIRTKTKLTIDSEEGDVMIESEDSLGIFTVKMIIQAIGRGFNPDKAIILANEKYTLLIIDITDYAGKSKKKKVRLKGRVIGEEGKSWKMIEKMTGCDLSVYGKTVAIIGPIEAAQVAREAVEDLLEGAPHGNVYKYVQEKMGQLSQGE